MEVYPRLAIGLRSATKNEIKDLHKQYPMGYHKTHKENGEKLPFNGVFYTWRNNCENT